VYLFRNRGIKIIMLRVNRGSCLNPHTIGDSRQMEYGPTFGDFPSEIQQIIFVEIVGGKELTRLALACKSIYSVVEFLSQKNPNLKTTANGHTSIK
jgi:hypothetical protein